MLVDGGVAVWQHCRVEKSCLTALLTFCPALASDNSNSWMYHLNRPLQIVLCWCGWMKYTHLNQWAMPVLLVKLLLCFNSVSVHGQGKNFRQIHRIVPPFHLKKDNTTKLFLLLIVIYIFHRCRPCLVVKRSQWTKFTIEIVAWQISYAPKIFNLRGRYTSPQPVTAAYLIWTSDK